MRMIRTQMQLPAEQIDRLKRLAAERRVSVAELVRKGVEVVLNEADRADGWKRTWEALEAGWAKQRAMPDDGGPTDVAVNHDKYLTDWIYERKIAPGLRRHQRAVRARVGKGAAKSRRKGGAR